MSEDEKTTSLGELLREFRGSITQDRIAKEAKAFGLGWSRSTVAQIEAGTRGLQAEELLLLPAIFEEVLGRPISGVSEILKTKDKILLSSGNQVHSFAIDGLLFGRPSDGSIAPWEILDSPKYKFFDASTWELISSDTGDEVITEINSAHERDAFLTLLIEESSQDAEQKASRRFGVPSLVITYLARELWGKSLTAEREERLELLQELAPEGKTVQGQRSAITQSLLRELEPELTHSRVAEAKASLRGLDVAGGKAGKLILKVTTQEEAQNLLLKKSNWLKEHLDGKR